MMHLASSLTYAGKDSALTLYMGASAALLACTVYSLSRKKGSNTFYPSRPLSIAWYTSLLWHCI